MEKTYIETCGSGLIYDTDMELAKYLGKNKQYLEFPGLQVFKDVPFDFPYYVIYRNDSNNTVICNSNSIEIHYPSKELTESSIIYMGYILMEKQRAEKSMVTIHSACIEKADSGILLLGRAGSGKTTTAIDLCTKYGYSLIGNDRNIIGLTPSNEVMCYDGTKFLFLRYESIKRNLPNLLHLFPSKEIDSWLRKVKILPNDIGISCSSNKKINKAFIVHIDNNKKELYTSNGDTPANRLYLNELFSMYIRGVCTTFSDKNFHAVGYIPSYDNPKYYSKRVHLIDEIFKSLNLEYLSGSVEDVSKYINENQKKLLYNKKRKGSD